MADGVGEPEGVRIGDPPPVSTLSTGSVPVEVVEGAGAGVATGVLGGVEIDTTTGVGADGVAGEGAVATGLGVDAGVGVGVADLTITVCFFAFFFKLLICCLSRRFSFESFLTFLRSLFCLCVLLWCFAGPATALVATTGSATAIATAITRALRPI